MFLGFSSNALKVFFLLGNGFSYLDESTANG